jgi:outer membrane murein-binding lipoprotein Lpp
VQARAGLEDTISELTQKLREQTEKLTDPGYDTGIQETHLQHIRQLEVLVLSLKQTNSEHEGSISALTETVGDLHRKIEEMELCRQPAIVSSSETLAGNDVQSESNDTDIEQLTAKVSGLELKMLELRTEKVQAADMFELEADQV